MARAGRKRRTGKREPNGNFQRPSDYANQQKAEVISIAVQQRKRLGGAEVSQDPGRRKQDGYRGADRAEWGYTMGILHMRGVISARQLAASNEHVRNYIRVHRLKGWPKVHAKVASYAEMIPGEGGIGMDADEKVIRNALDKWNAAQTAIIDSLGMREAMPAIHALNMFALYQAHPDECTPRSAGPLKEGCNALAKHYGV